MYIPLGYLRDFFRFLDANRDRIEVLTYDDLPWSDDWRHDLHYPGEAAAWRRSLRTGERDPRKIYLLLQHDVDSAPERTFDVLKLEQSFGLRSSVMIFRDHLDRRALVRRGELRPKAYIDDYTCLKEAEARGFTIGYHCNAYERTRFSRSEAERLMVEDVKSLRGDFSIRFMSAHGGARGPKGESNDSLRLPEELHRNIRWVHNGHSISEIVQFSDGGLNAGSQPAGEFDLRRFASSLAPGYRYRMIIHPQWYAHEVKPNPKLDSAWYREVLRLYAGSVSGNAWENVSLRPAGSVDPRFWHVRFKRWGARTLTRAASLVR
jgi:hypothetical protein